MQIMITHGALARTRVLQFSRWQLAAAAVALALLLMLTSGAVYHWFFLKAARDGWPVVSTLVRFVVRDETAQRERFLRENLDAMAQKVGEMQARLIRLEAVGERVTGLAGVKSEDLAPLQRGSVPAAGGRSPAPGPGADRPAGAKSSEKGADKGAGKGAQAPAKPLATAQGGLYVPLERPTLEQLDQVLGWLGERAEQTADLFTLAESRLFEERMRALMVPSIVPVEGPVGSGFGFRSDPFAGRMALHTGLDFPADVGTPVRAAAGGVVLSVGWHPQYGQVLEIDHGNGLSTLYAHLSKARAAAGDIVRRGQVVAEVGNTGRSTGPHLHFEVLLDGVPQDPSRFLAARPASPSGRVGRMVK
jgi:murein DD-endopeptidase MepM/ murein hydrolase activator NlpD